jgi:hypothetical protein
MTKYKNTSQNPKKGDVMLYKGEFKLGEGSVMEMKENNGPPKDKWNPLGVKECEVSCLLNQIHANHLWYPSIHQNPSQEDDVKG